MPVRLEGGVIYDGRSVILSLAAWHFGWPAALISGTLAIFFRVWIGGAGAIGGVLVILSSCSLGLLMRKFVPLDNRKASLVETLGFGILVHLFMWVILSRALPVEESRFFHQHLLLPVLVFFPLATLLAHRILLDQKQIRLQYRHLLESEQRFRKTLTQRETILDLAMDGFWMVDDSGKILEVNQRYCEMTGFTRGELLSMTVLDLDADETREDFRKTNERIAESRTLRVERRHRIKSGDILILEVNTSILIEGTSRRFCSFFRDLTLQKRQEDQMRLHSAALAATANAVVITDAAGLVEWANDSFTRSTGYTLEEAQGRRPGDLLKSGHHDDGFYQQMWQTIRKGKVWSGEIINRRKDQTLSEEHRTITPLTGEGGRIQHYIAIKQDLTEQKDLERLLLRAQRVESMDRLSSGIAHDLNNILSPLRCVPASGPQNEVRLCAGIRHAVCGILPGKRRNHIGGG